MTKIYGASDDLIEIEGDISEEANHYNAKDISIQISDGTIAKITYDKDGNWKIELEVVGKLFNRLIKCVNDEIPHTDSDCIGTSDYSDVLIMNSGVEWVKIANRKY